MKLPRKIILISSCTLLGVIIIALAAAWHLGLLSLLLPIPGEDDSKYLNIFGQTEQQSAELSTADSSKDNPGSSPDEIALPESLKAGKSTRQQQIEAHYIARLQKIAGGYEGQLNSLVGKAAADCSANRDKSSLAALARKYIAAGNSLEAQCDAQFYAVLREFESELQKNSFSTDTPKIAKQEYERRKAARKKQLLSAAVQQL